MARISIRRENLLLTLAVNGTDCSSIGLVAAKTDTFTPGVQRA